MAAEGDLRALLPGGVRALASSRREGDLRPGAGGTAAQRRLVDRPWSLVRQVHGAGVVVVEEPGGPSLLEADAMVTTCPEACLAVLGADCALVGLASPEGVFGVAHAGWRGLLAGVLGETVAALRRLGASRLEAVLGPCVHPECYAFGPALLAELVAALGPAVASTTTGGAPALDLPAGVELALEREGVPAPARLGGCTACGEGYFSYRARSEGGRQALVLWRPCPDGAHADGAHADGAHAGGARPAGALG